MTVVEGGRSSYMQCDVGWLAACPSSQPRPGSQRAARWRAGCLDDWLGSGYNPPCASYHFRTAGSYGVRVRCNLRQDRLARNEARHRDRHLLGGQLCSYRHFGPVYQAVSSFHRPGHSLCMVPDPWGRKLPLGPVHELLFGQPGRCRQVRIPDIHSPPVFCRPGDYLPWRTAGSAGGCGHCCHRLGVHLNRNGKKPWYN